MQEKIIEIKTCKQCNSSFKITDKDIEFYKKVSPKFNGKIFEIPTPTLCQDCRQQRRLAFRNERKLYKRKCAKTGENIISIFSPDKKLKVYSQKVWWSDEWDAFDYWINFDFEKWFFEQFNNLQLNVPVQALNNKLVENCDFVNDCVSCKDCYMIYDSIHSENSFYSYTLRDWDNCVDTAYCDKCYNSYELLECWWNSHNLFFSFKTSKSNNSYFLYNCMKCEECIWCTNLIDKKYHIFNKQYDKNLYFIEKEKLFKKWFDYIREKYEKIVKTCFKKYMFWYANENVYWDNMFYSKNCNECYDSNHLEDCKYVYTAMQVKDSYDIYLFWKNLDLSYESIAIWENSSKILFSNSCSIDCYNILYSKDLFWCKNCFWCIGLKNKEYCILNKQYTKEKYNKLVPKIIEKIKADWKWWEFFPESISQFWYNETVANEYYPLTKQEVLEKWFNWSDYEATLPKVEKIILASKLPKNIADIPDDILNWTVECEVSKKPFRIIKQELEFYRKYNIPIPKKHPDQRHLDRVWKRNPRKLYDRKCDKCWTQMKTTYNLDREEMVYCEECYNEEVY